MNLKWSEDVAVFVLVQSSVPLPVDVLYSPEGETSSVRRDYYRWCGIFPYQHGDLYVEMEMKPLNNRIGGVEEKIRFSSPMKFNDQS